VAKRIANDNVIRYVKPNADECVLTNATHFQQIHFTVIFVHA